MNKFKSERPYSDIDVTERLFADFDLRSKDRIVDVKRGTGTMRRVLPSMNLSYHDLMAGEPGYSATVQVKTVDTVKVEMSVEDWERFAHDYYRQRADLTNISEIIDRYRAEEYDRNTAIKSNSAVQTAWEQFLTLKALCQ